MNVSLDWYKIFYEVAKKQNITVAAENLCISQTARRKFKCGIVFKNKKRCNFN